MTWLGPEDEWPTHLRGEAQEALRESKAKGWSLRPTGHALGWIRCPHEDHPDRFKLLVFRTPSGDASGTETAKQIRRQLAKCASAQEDAQQHADNASLRVELEKLTPLVEHAEHLQQSERLNAAAEEVLEGDLDTASEDDLLRNALAFESEAKALEVTAWAGAAAFGLGEPWPPDHGAIELARAADATLDEILQKYLNIEIDGATEALIEEMRSRLARVRDAD